MQTMVVPSALGDAASLRVGSRVWVANPYAEPPASPPSADAPPSYRSTWLPPRVCGRPLWVPAEVTGLTAALNGEVAGVTVRTMLLPPLALCVPPSEVSAPPVSSSRRSCCGCSICWTAAAPRAAEALAAAQSLPRMKRQQRALAAEFLRCARCVSQLARSPLRSPPAPLCR